MFETKPWTKNSKHPTHLWKTTPLQTQTHNTQQITSGTVLLTAVTHTKDTTYQHCRTNEPINLSLTWDGISLLGSDPPQTNNPFRSEVANRINFYPRTGNFHQQYNRPKTWYSSSSTCSDRSIHPLLQREQANQKIPTAVIKCYLNTIILYFKKHRLKALTYLRQHYTTYTPLSNTHLYSIWPIHNHHPQRRRPQVPHNNHHHHNLDHYKWVPKVPILYVY